MPERSSPERRAEVTGEEEEEVTEEALTYIAGEEEEVAREEEEVTGEALAYFAGEEEEGFAGEEEEVAGEEFTGAPERRKEKL